MRRTYAGFTLVEILISVAIIAILAGIVFASLSRVRDKGDDSKRVADVQQIELALKVYRSTNGEYPETEENGSLKALDVLAPTYISEVPNDPLNDGATPSWDDTPFDQNTYYYWRADDMPSGCAASEYIIWYHQEESDDGNAEECVSIDEHSYTLQK